MNPQPPVIVFRDMLSSQMVGIREGKRSQAAKDENVPDSLQATIGHLFGDKRVNLRLHEMVFGIVVFLLELVAVKRILANPLIPQTIENEVLQTA